MHMYLVLAGKLAAEVVVDRAAGLTPSRPDKEIMADIVDKARLAKPKDPVGVKGEGAIAFGGGAVMGTKFREQLQEVDPTVLIATK
jgi:15-cis-phytoene desaturase